MFRTEEIKGATVAAFGTTRIFFLQNHDLLDVHAFAFEDSTPVWSQAKVLSVKNVGGSVSADVAVEDSETEGSEDEDEKSPELSEFMLVTASIIEKKRDDEERKE